MAPQKLCRPALAVKNGRRRKLGALGDLLNELIDGAVTAERPREIILGEMADSSGWSMEEINTVLQGDSAGVDVAALVAWAGVLGSPLSPLVVAAEEDGVDLVNASEEEAPPEEAPEGEPPMDAPLSYQDPIAVDIEARTRELELA